MFTTTIDPNQLLQLYYTQRDRYHFNTWQTLIGLITGVTLMSLKEKEKETLENERESALGPIPALVIAEPHLLELYSGHTLLTELEASMTYLLQLLILFHRLVWTLGQPSLQSHAAHFLQQYPPKSTVSLCPVPRL